MIAVCRGKKDSECGVQFLLEDGTTNIRLFKSEAEARDTLIKNGYLEENINTYNFVEINEKMTIKEIIEKLTGESGIDPAAITVVHDLGF